MTGWYVRPYLFQNFDVDVLPHLVKKWLSRLVCGAVLGVWVMFSKSSFFKVNSSAIGTFMFVQGVQLILDQNLNLVIRLIYFDELAEERTNVGVNDLRRARAVYLVTMLVFPVAHVLADRCKGRGKREEFAFSDETFELI